MTRNLVLNNEFFGHGSDELGARLMKSFLLTLLSSSTKPNKIILYNSGVKLLAQDSPSLNTLIELNAAGVQLVACGTCVSFYGLDDQISKVHVSNMQEIVQIIMQSESVATV
jgi:selenium metabolism protein YedF